MPCSSGADAALWSRVVRFGLGKIKWQQELTRASYRRPVAAGLLSLLDIGKQCPGIRSIAAAACKRHRLLLAVWRTRNVFDAIRSMSG